ncbi:MAG: hypothetical protein IPM29_26305 [Planctomycetes bacterium]|nr:hypothetical protein [Planctomycetota bacterium]
MTNRMRGAASGRWLLWVTALVAFGVFWLLSDVFRPKQADVQRGAPERTPDDLVMHGVDAQVPALGNLTAVLLQLRTRLEERQARVEQQLANRSPRAPGQPIDFRAADAPAKVAGADWWDLALLCAGLDEALITETVDPDRTDRLVADLARILPAMGKRAVAADGGDLARTARRDLLMVLAAIGERLAYVRAADAVVDQAIESWEVGVAAYNESVPAGGMQLLPHAMLVGEVHEALRQLELVCELVPRARDQAEQERYAEMLDQLLDRLTLHCLQLVDLEWWWQPLQRGLVEPDQLTVRARLLAEELEDPVLRRRAEAIGRGLTSRRDGRQTPGSTGR